MKSILKIYENYMKTIWKYVKSIWKAYEKYMKIIWKVYEKYVKRIWKIYEMYMKRLVALHLVLRTDWREYYNWRSGNVFFETLIRKNFLHSFLGQLRPAVSYTPHPGQWSDHELQGKPYKRETAASVRGFSVDICARSWKRGPGFLTVISFSLSTESSVTSHDITNDYIKTVVVFFW